MDEEAIKVKIRGQKYSFMGTLCAIIVILIMFFLSKYVFKNEDSASNGEEIPTESTYVYPAVQAQFGVLPSE